MGSQIGVEWAIAGHQVTFLVNRRAEAEQRVQNALTLAESLDLWPPDSVTAARDLIGFQDTVGALNPSCDLFLESIPEHLELKVALLREAASHMPTAILASNTSAISISVLGEGSGSPERTVGVHYWNPPLLMPLVEIISGEKTDSAVRDRVVIELRRIGKRPMAVDRDVPGFVWNRLQFALLREAVWIVENGVTAPGIVDEIVRDGLARRWRHTGPFATASLGGPVTFGTIANDLWPELSSATAISDLAQWLNDDPHRLAEIKRVRDAGLLNDLRTDLLSEERTADAPLA